MKSRHILNAAAVVLAGLAGLTVFVYANNADRRAIADQQPVDLVVSVAEVPRGTSLKAALRDGLIVETAVATVAFPNGGLGSVSAANENFIALNDVPAGQPLFATNFVAVLPNMGPLEVPAGMVAMSVELKDPAHVGSFVVPGSEIVVFQTSTLLQKNDTSLESTTVLFGRVLVLAVDIRTLNREAVEDEAGVEAQETLVTVALTPAQATVMAHAANTATLYLGLLETSSLMNENDVVTTSDIFAGRR
jgi:pilus assembly protein CpaB